MSVTIADVRGAFEAEHAAIFALDEVLAEERRTLKLTAFAADRGLNDAEVARRKEIGATRAELGDALEELALSTLQNLDAASDVDALLREIDAINAGLKDDIDHLKAIEKHAEIAAKVLSGLATAAEKLIGFKASLLG